MPDESQVPREACAGQSVGITLDDEVFVDRGDLICGGRCAGQGVAPAARARVLAARGAARASATPITVRIGAAEGRGTIALIDMRSIRASSPRPRPRASAQNHVGEIEIALAQPIAADLHALNPRTGRVVLEFDGRIAGGGLVLCDRRAATHGLGDLQALAARLNRELAAALSPAERIARFRREVDGRIVFTTSFGLEDQVLTQLIDERAIDIEIVTLDTGRLFPETYDAVGGDRTPLRPPHPRVLSAHGRSRGAGRRARHQRLLRLARSAARPAATCARSSRSTARSPARAAGSPGCAPTSRPTAAAVALVTVDAERGLLKLNPLFDWTRDAALSHAPAHDVPINPLHAQGFLSIGCAPCTRAIAPGEPERAGRWWWEQEDKKECGLHTRHAATRSTS